jgi:hypothetical protein
MKQKNEEILSPLDVAAKVARQRAQAYKTLLWSIVGIAVSLMAAVLFSGCETVKYIPVASEHTETHWRVDTVFQRDSVVKESLTTVMQVDSATMAKYGVQLQKAERAWLIKTQELERIVDELMAKSEVRDTVRDSIPYPVEVIKEVPAKVSGWQAGLMRVGFVALLLLLGIVCWVFGGLLLKIKNKLL